MARQKKSEEQRQNEQRREELRAWLVQAERKHRDLTEVVGALYDEVDKLNRKWPTMPVSELMLDKANRIIRAVKDLLAEHDSDLIADIHEFVPAGDQPQTRDVAVVLSEVKAVLRRFDQRRDKTSIMLRQYASE